MKLSLFYVSNKDSVENMFCSRSYSLSLKNSQFRTDQTTRVYSWIKKMISAFLTIADERKIV
jgi:hypothetical protein